MEACEDVRALTALRPLFGTTLRRLGFSSFALTTHLPADDLRSCSVELHDWPEAVFEHLRHADNPLFLLCEQLHQPVFWSSQRWRAAMTPAERSWLAQLQELRPGHGVTEALRHRHFGVSCSLVAAQPIEADTLRWAMRIAHCAFDRALWLQRPTPAPADRITDRERQCAYEIVVRDRPPRAIAADLGVELTTVRSHLRKAQMRMDAKTPWHAGMRLLETGQLLNRGRSRKRR